MQNTTQPIPVAARLDEWKESYYVGASDFTEGFLKAVAAAADDHGRVRAFSQTSGWLRSFAAAKNSLAPELANVLRELGGIFDEMTTRAA